MKNLLEDKRGSITVFHRNMKNIITEALVLPGFLRDRRLYFSFPWYISENNFQSLAMFLGECKANRRYNPSNFCMLINSREEMYLADQYISGLIDYIHFNNSAFINEKRIIPDRKILKKYDAVYLARASKFKRHFLTRNVERKFFISYDWQGDQVDLNAFRPLKIMRNVKYREIGDAVSEARVGLMLSEEEGACYASLEYLLLGMPVISTPSKGGRDEYYNDRNSIIVEATPDAVRLGVDEALSKLENGDFEPDEIRSNAIQKMKEFRKTLSADLQNCFYNWGIEYPADELLERRIYATTKLWKYRNMRVKSLADIM